MPRFYLNLLKGNVRINDPEGADYLGIDEALVEAVTAAREIMSDLILRGIQPGLGSIEITNAVGLVLHDLPFNDALRPD